VDDLSWRGKPEVLAEFSNRNNYPISTQEPVIKGKVLVIGMDGTPSFDDYYNQLLPADLKPHRKEDVGTIVWTRHFREAVGRYASGHVAVQETYEVTIVDHRTKQTIWTTTFKGGMPDKEVRYQESQRRDMDRDGISGGYPTEAVLQYLLKLPRQQP